MVHCTSEQEYNTIQYNWLSSVNEPITITNWKLINNIDIPGHTDIYTKKERKQLPVHKQTGTPRKTAEASIEIGALGRSFASYHFGGQNPVWSQD